MQSRYHVLRPLESGRRVRVYAVEDHWEGKARKVLTLLDPDLSQPREKLEFEKLFELRHSLDHPLLVEVSDLVFKGNRLGVVSEFVHGDSFSQCLNLPLTTRQKVALRLAQLLSFLHRRGFFCGYLKPSQLFVLPGSSAEPVFNILFPRTWSGSGRAGSDSVQYISPECLNSARPGTRGDLYSLGMVFYHLFTGYPPFAEGDPDTLFQKQLLTHPLRPRRLNPDIPPKVEQLILDLVEKDPALRPPSAEYVAEVLADGEEEPDAFPPRFRSAVVGREVEVGLFRRVFQEFLDSSAVRFVVIGGSSGIGKTRLMERFATIGKVSRAEVINLCHRPGDGVFAAFRPLLGDGISQESLAGGGIEGLFRQDTNAVAVLEVLKKLAQKRPLLLCVNDLQWMDEGSLKVYQGLSRISDRPVLVIGNYRTDELPSHWEDLRSEIVRRGTVTELMLRPFKAQEVGKLVRNLLGDSPSPELQVKLSSECAGNPFYIYESLRFMHERGELSFQHGHWAWKARLKSPLVVPGTVTQQIRARLSALSPDQFKTVACLSLSERPLPVDLLARVLEVEVGELEERIALLERLDLAARSGNFERPFVLPAHDWILTVVRDELGPKEKKRLHKSLASVLEEEYAKTQDPLILKALVKHLLESGQKSENGKFIWEAIESLVQGRLYKDAAKLIELAMRSGAISSKKWHGVKKTIELLYLSGQLDRCVHFCEQFLSRSPTLGRNKRAYVLLVLGQISLTRAELPLALQRFKEGLSLLQEQGDPELRGDLTGQWLFCLSGMGQSTQAEQIAGRLLADSSKQGEVACLDRIYHALCALHHDRGDLEKAISCERVAIRLAFEHGKYVRAVGRICNLGLCFCHVGKLAHAYRFGRYSLELSRELENPNLMLFARYTFDFQDRKHGRHQKAVQGITELLAISQEVNPNRHIEAEAYIELAKNLDYQLFPERALRLVERCKQVLAEGGFATSFDDAALLEAWTWVLLGRPAEALQVASPLAESENLTVRGRHPLLCAQANLLLGNLDRAWGEACRAFETFPGYMIYYRTRTRLAQADIALAREDLDEAKKCAQEGLSWAKAEFYLPLMAKGYLLHARCLAAEGEQRRARVFGLRALQLMRHVERPGLRAEIHRALGNIHVALGDRDRALHHFSEALHLLKERLLHLSSAHRELFAGQFIAPIEAERDRVLAQASCPAPHYLVQLRHLAATLKEIQDQKVLAARVLHAVSDSVPGVPINIFLRPSPGGPFKLAASHGRCKETGRQLLSKAEGYNQLFLSGGDSGLSLAASWGLGIPLRAKGHLLGLIYLEHQGRGLTEAEIDYLSCLGSILEMHLTARLPSRAAEGYVASGRSLALRDGTRIIGYHALMQKLFDEVVRLADKDATVLISGESGTGKELIARAIHELSRRNQGRFVPINCSAFPEGLIESELFGHMRGSFTGAVSDKRGLFEVASGGTLFLDEIATMPLLLQPHLLRALQDKTIRRVGDTQERPVDVRIVAASNQCLKELVRRGLFRVDLYHRLNVCHLAIPPLRERASDIAPLAYYFLERMNRQEGGEKEISDEAIDLLCRYSFPGNVRELENIIESAYHLCHGELIAEEDVSSRIAPGTEQDQGPGPGRAQRIFDGLTSGSLEFWGAVRDPFLRRDLSREEVRQIIALGLSASGGNYRRLLGHFSLPEQDYKRFMSFLDNYECKVDFRPFRKR